MRFRTFGLTTSLLLATPAFAATGAIQNTSTTGSLNVDASGSVRSAQFGSAKATLLAGDTKVWASPSGIGLNAVGSLASISGSTQTAIGTCTGSASVGQVTANASLGAQVGRIAKTGFTPLGGGSECNASVAASLVSVSGSCQTAAGTFGVGAQGPNAKAGCSCTGCTASVAWATVSGSYETPTVGGCGIAGSVAVNGGASAGVGVGAQGAAKGVGGSLTLGPLSAGISVNISKFDPAAMGQCAEHAAEAVAKTAGKIADGVAKTAGNVASAVASTAGNAWHDATSWVPCIFGCSSPKPATADGGSSAPGSNVNRNALTNAVAANSSSGTSTGHGVVRNQFSQ